MRGGMHTLHFGLFVCFFVNVGLEIMNAQDLERDHINLDTCMAEGKRSIINGVLLIERGYFEENCGVARALVNIWHLRADSLLAEDLVRLSLERSDGEVRFFFGEMLRSDGAQE